ncbi:MAG: hypothetical protein K6L81_06400 [Agarilytica sp.]
MNKAWLLLLAVSLHGVAGEVGAQNPQSLTGDTGASTSLAAVPYNAQPAGPAMVTEANLQDFEIQISKQDARMSQELEVIISEKVDYLLDGYHQPLLVSTGHF